MIPGAPWMRPLAALCIFLGSLNVLTKASINESHQSIRVVQQRRAFEPASRVPQSPILPMESESVDSTANSDILQDVRSAVSVMQEQYFALWLGRWTTAIDWTSAVMGTHLAATLSTLSRSLSYEMPGVPTASRKMEIEAQIVESEITKYFDQIVAFYFGQDYFSIRNQAYDDMLWVVLDWLETTQFIRMHSEEHYPDNGDGRGDWHARQFIPAFAHRARVFYELAEEGWDDVLCGGGMTWNPRFLPYKNAITNQLFISASAYMYLYFTGDDNCSPFMGAAPNPNLTPQYASQTSFSAEACTQDVDEPTYDPIYLSNAVKAYDWLANSGMINDAGLYTDGFHISGYKSNHSKTTCDERNEMVYTYNQGVVLSGLRALWEATGNYSYLSDGHELIGNVIRATGWTETSFTAFQIPSDLNSTSDSDSASTSSSSPPSHSTPPPTKRAARPSNLLGTNGILTEACDPSATCNQDAQTFKGIFFHHLTAFCAPLPSWPVRQGKTHHAVWRMRKLHMRSCDAYQPWVEKNAQAAMSTRDAKGRFGGWWAVDGRKKGSSKVVLPRGAAAWQNEGVPGAWKDPASDEGEGSDRKQEKVKEELKREHTRKSTDDPNDRGRGRTVETQSGGLAVVRANYEFLRRVGEFRLEEAAVES